MALLLTAAGDDGTICRNVTGDRDGLFHTFWHDRGEGCLTLASNGSYQVEWALESQDNLVAGRGWRRGSADRIVGYRAGRFNPGSNGYLTLYGWSKSPLVEYYVVDNWGDFTPPGPSAVPLGTVQSDGGTYRIYRMRRIEQPSISGTASFDQYWSVRTERRPIRRDSIITLANHVAAWRRAGMTLGSLDYQVLATEGFGSTGASAVRLWDQRGHAPR
ncbi:glycoside hydrolase family 11 protein [Sphingomonas sp. Sph1(2015)]|uniref:glycoside hydrolase family 11 protein n=2 Tax=Sphingomonas TaxID=13687 RepID=UPI0018E9AF36|nr:glycoside hydrolase family 11 protein [Sphingomonas sp. Sph1(2015)]